MRFAMARRWSDLGRVERVDLYTRQSLYLLLWLYCGTLLLTAADEAADAAQAVAFVGGGVAVAALGSLVMASVMSGYPQVRMPPRSRLVALAVVATGYVGVVGLGAADPVRGSVAAVVLGTVAASVGGLPDNRVTAAVLVLSGVLFGLGDGEVLDVAVGVGLGAVVVFSVRVSLWLNAIVAELDAARHAQARLAVAEERLRFSRDVHDVLGRRLSTIAVQAELAATLAERGDDRAAARMLEVRGVAHEALGEARELARGYRPTNLTTELDGARSLLRSAGIEVRLEVDVVPRAWHEAAGWVVRESVTNVLRHTTAGLVSISFVDHQLRVDNDGVRATDPAVGDRADGAGLRGLRERLGPLGASLSIQRDGEHWAVVAHLPGTGPLSAAAATDPAAP